MELETAFRRMLLTQGPVTGYVGQKVFKFSLLDRIDGTGGRAIVVRRSNGWAQPDTVQTSEFPIMVVDYWADPDRDTQGQKTADNALDKALAVHRTVDPLIQGRREQWWGAGGVDPGLLVVSCARWAEPFLRTPDDEHGSGPQAGDQPLGECSVVTVQYALHVVH